MLPRKLYLYNFMSYGADVPVLDFGQFDLVCLSGPNGAGKSSLLEAITWALWGESRAKSDDDLIHHGAKEMIVSFEFEFEGNKYKVVRKRSKQKKGQGQLEFFIFQNNEWQPYSGISKAETQKKINQLLRLDYKTFLNSAFLRQGHADEFTVKRPQERKAILAEILGLHQYDELQEKAKLQIKNYEVEKEGLTNFLERLKEEIKDKEKLKKVLNEKAEVLKKVENEIKIKEKAVEKIKEEKNILENQKNLTENLALKIEENKKEIAFLEQEIKQKTKLLVELQKIILRREEIEKGYKTWLDLKRKDEEWNKKFTLQNKLREEKNLLEEKIFLSQKKKEEEKENLEAKLQMLREEWVKQDAESKQISNEIQKIEEDLKNFLLGKAKCPLCGQPLREVHKTKIKEKYENEKKQKMAEKEECEKEKQKLVEEANKIKSQIKILETGHQTTEKNILAAIKEIERKISQVFYNEEEHNKIKAQKIDFEKYQILKIKLEEANKQKEMEAQLLEEKRKYLAQKKEILSSDLKAKERFAFDPKRLVEIEKSYNRESSELLKLRKRLLMIQEEYGISKEKMSQIEAKEQEVKKKEERLRKIEKEIAIFEELVEALGKKGVQAMIIESVLPEIEDEANKLLGKMTDDKMTVKIFTQKEKKTDGGIQETLDIQIQDGKSMRPYEMFSGGEAFRINFAIRIALSKLLARRAGAKLQFLVIDEGFGTQDAVGREYVIEAINSVRSDFKKIFVISHISEIKEAFPARIEVTKDEKGSHFEVVT